MGHTYRGGKSGCKLHALGLELSDAIVEVQNERGRKIGEHDLIMEVVSMPDGDVPDADYPSGFLSVELRMRRLWSENGRAKVRDIFRKDCLTDCKWWQDELNKNPDKWCGRAVVLADFGRSGTDFTTRADVL